MGHEQQEIVLSEVDVENGGRGKAAQQRGNRPARHIPEDDATLFGRQFENAGFGFARGGLILGNKRDFVAVLSDQAEPDRHDQRLFFGLAGGGRRLLRQVERKRLCVGVIGPARLEARGAGLTVPQEKWRQVAAGALGETGNEILDRRGLAVEALEIKRHAGVIGLMADQGRAACG